MTILLVIIGLSLLILLHEAGHFFAAKYFGLKVDEFGFGFPPKLFSKKKGDTEYTFNLLPFGGFVRIAGETDRILDEEKLNAEPEEVKQRMYFTQKAWKRSVIVLAGVFMNFIIGWFLMSLLFMIGGKTVLLVSDVQGGSPAESAGLQSGDIIKNYSKSQDFINFVNQNRGQEISLEILRGNKSETIKAVPQDRGDQGSLGIYLSEGGIPKFGFFKAIWEGLLMTGRIAWQTVDAFVQLLRNLFFKARLLEGVVGPLGIFGVANEAGKIGYLYLVQLLALISINLAVMNLIPFPALDGGRFFLILVEKIKGSPVSVKTEGIINATGFIFLVGLMILISIRDVANWF